MRGGASWLLGVFHVSGLPDDHHLDLAGIDQRFLDLPGDVAGEHGRFIVADLLGLDHDTDLAACLDGEDLLDALEALGNLLEVLQAA